MTEDQVTECVTAKLEGRFYPGQRVRFNARAYGTFPKRLVDGVVIRIHSKNPERSNCWILDFGDGLPHRSFNEAWIEAME